MTTAQVPANGRVALVTGAARGIGAATVLALATVGWAVLAVDSVAGDPALPYRMGTPADLSAVVEEAGRRVGAEGRVRSFVADVRDVPALTAAVAMAEEVWGGLDAALAVAGVIAGGVPLWEMPDEQEKAVVDIDLGGVINLARVTVPALLRRPVPRSGRFLAVASAAATQGIADAGRLLCGKSGSDRPDPRPRRGTRPYGGYRERGQPRVHRDRHPWTKAPCCTRCPH